MVNNLSIVLFDKPVSLDSIQIIKKVLHMCHEIMAKVFDRRFGLHDLFDFFTCKKFVHGRSGRHYLVPDINYAHRETEREVNQEHGRPKFEKTKIL